jgi:hypothetical protein
MDEASSLRDLSHEEIDRTIERRREWREMSLQRWHKTGTILGKQHNILARRRKEITDATVENLHTIAELFLTTPIDFKLVVSANQGHVYANDLALFDQMEQINGLERKSYSRAEINRPRNTVQLKNPRHQFRSYFKITKLTDVQKDHLMDFLYNQKDIRVSPALQQWIDQPFTRTQDYFFIDHGKMSWLTMLSLVRPGLIRKTMQIIPTK